MSDNRIRFSNDFVLKDKKVGINTINPQATLDVRGTAHILNNLGIGTTFPQEKLDVYGNGNFTGIVSASSFIGSGSSLTGLIPNTIEDIDVDSIYYPLLSSATSGTISSISVSSNSIVFNPALSYLGIGTTNPQAPLEISTKDGLVRFGDVTDTNSSTDTGLSFVPYNFGSSQLGVSSYRAALFTEVSGRILSYGINVIQLEETRDINYPGGIFRIDTRSSGNWADSNAFVVKRQPVGVASTQGEPGEVNAIVINLNSGNTYTVPNGGTLLVGTASTLSLIQSGPEMPVEVADNIKLQVGAASTPQGAYISGSIGIGSTNPEQKLDIAGSIKIDGGLYDSNNFRGNIDEVLVSTGSGIGVTWKSLTSGEFSASIQITPSSISTSYYITGSDVENGIKNELYSNSDIVFTGNGHLGIGTTIPKVSLDVNGNVIVSGISTFNEAITGTISTATRLETSRTFEITGDVVASPISFDGTGNVSLAATIQPNSVGLGTDTFGDYVKSISGNENQITVTGGSGEGSTPVISIPDSPILPGNVTIANDLKVNRDLNVSGNITVGGTTAIIYAQEFIVSDKEIILGFTTDSNGNEVSSDTTANGGGIAIASTEGNPLVDFNIAGIHTHPNTYKDIIWVKAGALGAGTTDAWHFNYAVGIGSTQVPNGVIFAAGAIQLTQDNLAVVGNINASGIVTANSFYGDGSKLTNVSATSGTATYAITAGVATYAGISTNVIGGIASVTSLNVSGVTTLGTVRISSGIVTATSGIVTYYGDGSKLTNVSAIYATNAGVSTYAITAGVATYAGISTNVIGGIASVTSLNVSGVTTLGTVRISSGIVTATSGIVTYYGDYYGTFKGTLDSNVILGVAEYAKVAGVATYANSAGVATNAQGLTGTPNIIVGIVTATEYYGTFKGTLDSNVILGVAEYAKVAGIATYATNSGVATYANVSGIATYATNSGVATYANVSGVSTYATNSGVATYANVSGIATYTVNAGVATYANVSGIATYAVNAGVATYANVSGIATYSVNSGIATNVIGGIASVTSLNVSGISTLGTVQISSGIVTATSGIVTYYGDGSKLQGVTAFYVDTQVNTNEPVYPTLAAGVGVNSVGISTSKLVFVDSISSLGIGTTYPTSNLDVRGDAYFSGIITATDFNSASDIKLKTNINQIESPIEKLNQIQGVSFDWISSGKSSMGVIADNLQKVLPELVSDTDPKTVNYNGLIGLLIECVKQQQVEIEELKRKVE